MSLVLPGDAENDPKAIGLMGEARRKAALARDVADWMEIYTEIVRHQLEQMAAANLNDEGLLFEKWKSETRPRLRRVGKRFQEAGLVLDSRMQVEGVEVGRGGGLPIFLEPHKPWVRFFWPTGESLKFTGEDAVSAFGFFLWWSNFQVPILGPENVGQTKTYLPGDPEYDAYFAAKRADMNRGIEPA